MNRISKFFSLLQHREEMVQRKKRALTDKTGSAEGHFECARCLFRCWKAVFSFYCRIIRAWYWNAIFLSSFSWLFFSITCGRILIVKTCGITILPVQSPPLSEKISRQNRADLFFFSFSDARGKGDGSVVLSENEFAHMRRHSSVMLYGPRIKKWEALSSGSASDGDCSCTVFFLTPFYLQVNI